MGRCPIPGWAQTQSGASRPSVACLLRFPPFFTIYFYWCRFAVLTPFIVGDGAGIPHTLVPSTTPFFSP